MKKVKSAGIALGAAASVLFTPALAFAEGTESGGVDILIPKIAEFIPALVIFLIIWFLLSKFVWPKVISVLDAREHKIEDSLEQADATKAEAAEIREQADAIVATDEAMAVERLGLHPALVEGREDNLKVTTPADLALAEFLLARTR